MIAENNRALKKKATCASVLVATLLILIKAFAWTHTHSISILSTLTDSTLDLAASLITLGAVYHAGRPPSEEFKFGLGKLESLGAIAQAFVIVISGIFILKASVDRLFNPAPIENPNLGIVVLIFSLGITIVLVLFQKQVIEKTGSLSVIADSAHYQSDIFLNGGGLIALGMYSWLGWAFLDSLVGCLVALYIFWAAYSISHKSFRILLDAEIPSDEREAIYKILEDHPQVGEVFSLKTRTSGEQHYIYASIVLPAKTTIEDSHTLLKSLEKKIANLYPGAEVVLHPKPSKKKT
ncbi:MAG: cation diffusion facilitator family transporter [Alphaproteobacteria bacterium]